MSNTNETKATRTNRTPEQIIADAQDMIQRAQEKQAMRAATGNPACSALLEQLAARRKKHTADGVLLGSGPQSVAQRVKLHQRRIEEIQAKGEGAYSREESWESERDNLLAEIQVTALENPLAEDQEEATA